MTRSEGGFEHRYHRMMIDKSLHLMRSWKAAERSGDSSQVFRRNDSVFDHSSLAQAESHLLSADPPDKSLLKDPSQVAHRRAPSRDRHRPASKPQIQPRVSKLQLPKIRKQGDPKPA